MAWDAIGGADDYEVQVVSFATGSFASSSETYVVTDPTFFRPAYSRERIRFRARKLDPVTCGASLDNRCLSEWSEWYQVRFVPTEEVETSLPELPDDEDEDPSIAEFRQRMREIVEGTLGAAGVEVSPQQVFEFGVWTFALVIGSVSVALSWRRGMAPLGVGMGLAAVILILFAGYRLLGTNIAWPIAVQLIVAVVGLYALARQFGVFR